MNYNELNKHKKSDAIKWITVLVAIVLLSVSVAAAMTQGFTDANPYGWFDDDTEEQTPAQEEQNDNTDDTTTPEISADMIVSNVEENGVLLSMGDTIALASSDGDYLSKTITATVLPSDAPNKLVDWTIEWAEGTTLTSSDISSYLTITPSSDGSTTATVNCYKGFEGSSAVITCKTRVGGFTAICQVSYVGVPETITVNMNGLTSAKESTWGVDMYSLNCGTTYTIDLGLDNILHEVGSSYGNYTLSMEAHGGYNYAVYSVNSSTGELTKTGTTGSMTAIGGGTTTDTNGNVYASVQIGNGYGDLIRANVSNGKITIWATDAVTGLQKTIYGRSGDVVHKFDSYVDGKIIYFTLTITENTSGITKTLNFKSIASVQSVSLSATSLSF